MVSVATAAVCHAVTQASFTHVQVSGADPGGEPLEKAIADINGDGKKDIIIGMGNAFGPGGIYWWQCPSGGPTAGSWTKHTIVASGNCYEHSQILDLNGDGKPDLICSYNSNVVWFQHPGGDGTGTWLGPNQIATGIGHEVRLADMDGDGKMDVVTSRTRNIDFQNSSTSWQIVGWGGTASGSALDGMALLDIGSGKGAINIVGATTTGLYWFRNPRETGGNARTGTWTAFKIGDHDTGGPCLATMDVNGDGRMDLVQCPNEGTQGTTGLVWWQAPADRTQLWTKHTIDTNWQAVHWIEPADMNNDGHLDFIISEQEQAHDPSGGPYTYNNDKVGIYYDDGLGNLTFQLLETTGGQNVVSADIEGDGDLDFAFANHGVFGAPHPIELYVNNIVGSGGTGGSLTGGVVGGSTSTYNLTSLGTTDWAHWNGTYVHKSSGGGKISDVTRVGAGNYGTFSETQRNVSWSDGTPTASNGDDQTYIWCNNKQNAGWTFTVPADTTTRTLNVLYGGAAGAVVQITAHLSDSSATDWTNTQTITSGTPLVGTFTYHAASASQTLLITLLKVQDATSPSVDLDAAWLTTSTSSPLMFETENLTVAAQTAGITHRTSPDSRFSNGNGTFFDSTAVGQFVTYDVPNVAIGTYDVRVGIKKWNNKAQWQCAISRLDQQGSATNVGPVVDEYDPNEVFTEVDLGLWTPGSTSDKAFKFTVTGKNASGSGFGLAFDYIKLIPQ